MEDLSKMRKIEKLEKYVIVPNVNFVGGFVYDGEDIFLCDDEDIDKVKLKDGTEVEQNRVRVRQWIKDNILYTDLERSYHLLNGKKVFEKSHQEAEIDKGEKLFYQKGYGYMISTYKLCTIEDAIKRYDILRGVDNES